MTHTIANVMVVVVVVVIIVVVVADSAATVANAYNAIYAIFHEFDAAVFDANVGRPGNRERRRAVFRKRRRGHIRNGVRIEQRPRGHRQRRRQRRRRRVRRR